jgi:hypothetical protein
VLAQHSELDSAEANTLELLLLFSATMEMHYEGGYEYWGDSVFADFAADEGHLTANLENLAQQYAVEVDEGWWGCFSVFWDIEELDFYCNLFSNQSWRDEWSSYVSATAYLEEFNIREIRRALAETDEELLITAYTELLGVANTHLLYLASILHDNPFDYVAQLLDQADVDLALYEAMAMTGEDFELNTGFNDAWYEPATDGQGFFITVYPEKGTVFVGWFTFDMDFPGQDVVAGLGDACQRWLTAQGPYDGNEANLVVYNSSGGLFDSVLAVPELEPIGSIALQFENCESGTVSYDLPSYGLIGEIPIQRVASDNIAACQKQSYLNR